MSRLARTLLPLAAIAAMLLPAHAEELRALARIDPAKSSVAAINDTLAVTLTLSQPVPWRAYTLADPPRLVMDFSEVDWRGSDTGPALRTRRVTAMRSGVLGSGWSRLVLDLDGYYTIASAEMTTGPAPGKAVIDVVLSPANEAEFRASPGATGDQRSPDKALPEAGAQPATVTGPLTIVLDPGHGGIDPGAQNIGVTEADLMLAFARELQDALIRTGYRVVLTRNDDSFVPLDTRITIARAAGADLFLSLHADAVMEGSATGASVYTLSETASDEAAAALAERHDRSDLLAGVDLSDQDDVVAGVLMDIARIDSAPRSDALADAIVEGLGNSVGGLHKTPRLSAGFSVLKAPDVPSVLIELGFISSAEDRDRLVSPEWRKAAAAGIVTALQAWEVEDIARRGLVRR